MYKLLNILGANNQSNSKAHDFIQKLNVVFDPSLKDQVPKNLYQNRGHFYKIQVQPKEELVLCNCETYYYKCSCPISNLFRYALFPNYEPPSHCRNHMDVWNVGTKRRAKGHLLNNLIDDKKRQLTLSDPEIPYIQKYERHPTATSGSLSIPSIHSDASAKTLKYMYNV